MPLMSGWSLCYSITSNVLVSVKADRKNHYMKDAEPLPRVEVKRNYTNIRYGFVVRLSNRVLSSKDNILVSTIVRTAMVCIYAQYPMLINGFLRLFTQANDAMAGPVWKPMATESAEFCERIFRKNAWVCFVGVALVASCFLAGTFSYF